MCDKSALREKMKIKRRYFQNSAREVADSAIAQNFLEAFSNYQSFFVYNSYNGEADTKSIIAALLSMQKKIFLPRVEGDVMVAASFGETQKGIFGIEEPKTETYFGDIDVTVIPLLAINSLGMRIGYGKGYYDKYLKDKHTVKVGIGYSFQMEEFEADEWDIPLNVFVCEKGLYYYGA